MKIEKREDGITLVPESSFENEVLKSIKRESISRMHFENDWESKGKFFIDFDRNWDR